MPLFVVAGALVAPAAFEAMFVSTAHTEKDLEKTLAAHREALKEAFGAVAA
jgi:glutamate-1-semialdehyde 2,1-aminomutase